MTAPLSETLIRRNIESPLAIPRTELDEVFAHVAAESVGRRITLWASYFLDRGDAKYVYGDEPSGYVSRGLLVDDFHLDCVLFVCRVVELATSGSPNGALRRALALRFGGAPAHEVIRADGSIDYGHPSRITHSWDLIRRGGFGQVVSEEAGDVATDCGTARFTAGDVRYVPKRDARLKAVNDGDLLFFVLDESNVAAAEVRDRTGAVVGHMGVARRSADGVELIHAASHDLLGAYFGGRVVTVALREYLDRVERFKGIVVTRIS